MLLDEHLLGYLLWAKFLTTSWVCCSQWY